MARNKSKDLGWIKIYRTLFESELWLGYPFTPGQAWIDLIGLANYAETEHFFRGQVQVVKRGQIATSEAYLAKRWHWSRSRVRRYIKMLEKLKMCTAIRTADGTTLTVENYDKYQSVRPTLDTSLDTSDDTTVDTSGDTQKKNIRNVKEGEERARGASPNDASHGLVFIEEMENGMRVYERPDGTRQYIPKGAEI